MTAYKGFIKDWVGNKILPITRGELVLDSNGNIALQSDLFLAKDGHPGLVTAAERAMINGSLSGEQNLLDIYNKLEYVNKGLQINGSSINFYNANGEPTPINLKSDGNNKISLAVVDNIINLGLSELTQQDVYYAKNIKNLTVDKYGRIINATSEDLTNEDLPDIISNKAITNSQLSGCYTTEVGNASTSLVNKEYVDAKFSAASGVAAGGLLFGGILNSSTLAEEKLIAIYNNHYFKVTGQFTLAKTNFYEPSDILGDTVNLKIGDTLIVYKPIGNDYKFVYIPSADDITTISVRKANADNTITNILSYETGNVILKFSSLFDVINSSTGMASISLPVASSTSDGYLSKSDWIKFNSYSTTLGTSYTGEFESGAGVYKIGTLTIGEDSKILYGKNNISTLSLLGTINPTLKFTETGQLDTEITLKGSSGIQIQKNDNNIEIISILDIAQQIVPDTDRTVEYFNIDSNYKLQAVIGTIDVDGSVIDGLTDYQEFVNLRTAVLTNTSIFETINYSLNDPINESEYRYGNDKLKTAINITI